MSHRRTAQTLPRSFSRMLALGVTLVAMTAPTASAAPPRLPALPTSDAPTKTPPSEGAAPSAKQTGPQADLAMQGATPPSARDVGAAGDSVERARRGVVTIERDGRVLGVGMVLANDGRIVTALSTLGAGDSADVRYADNSVTHVRVGHQDKAWDLALLVPLAGKRTEGLSASEADPAAVEMRGFAARGPKAVTAPLLLRGRTDARSRDGEALSGALELDFRGAAPGVGTPIVDNTGGVLGILVRACRAADSGACIPTIVGAPVAVLRSFLVRTPQNAVAPSPFLGIVGSADAAGASGSVRGVRVMAIAPTSPAEKAGLRANDDRAQADLIVAVNGVPVDRPEKLAELISKKAVGDTVKLLVFSSEKFREAAVVLRPAP